MGKKIKISIWRHIKIEQQLKTTTLKCDTAVNNFVQHSKRCEVNMIKYIERVIVMITLFLMSSYHMYLKYGHYIHIRAMWNLPKTQHKLLPILWHMEANTSLSFTLEYVPIVPRWRITNTVRCLYNAVNFLQNPHNRHPIARPWGRDMGCLLRF